MTGRKTVVLYSRPGCHLCDESRRILQRLAADYPFTIHEVDITVDHDAFLRYWAAIPVVAVGDSIVPAALDEAQLRTVFDWEFRDDAASA